MRRSIGWLAPALLPLLVMATPAAAGKGNVEMPPGCAAKSNPGCSRIAAAIAPPNTPPTASFIWECLPDFRTCTLGAGDVRFTDTSTDPDGTIASRQWSFGSNLQVVTISTSDLLNIAEPCPQGQSQRLVTLTVRDDDGAERSVTQCVLPPPF